MLPSRRLYVLLFIAITTLAIICTTLPAAHAECFWVDHIDSDPTYVCVPDLYYTAITSPDWCSYVQGDWVFIKFDPNIPNAPIESYYFIPSYDWTTTAPAGFYPYRFYVLNNAVAGCRFSIF